MKVWLDESAVKVLSTVREKKGEPYVTIVEDGCCSFSGVFVRLDKPDSSFVYLGDAEGFEIYIRDSLYPLYTKHVLGITALERVDDSFSAETAFGYKLTLFYNPEETDDKSGKQQENVKTPQYL
ncbi:MAG: hypothetical protein QXV32_02680 [Conexivisphaerales archaeon]